MADAASAGPGQARPLRAQVRAPTVNDGGGAALVDGGGLMEGRERRWGTLSPKPPGIYRLVLPQQKGVAGRPSPRGKPRGDFIFRPPGLPPARSPKSRGLATAPSRTVIRIGLPALNFPDCAQSTPAARCARGRDCRDAAHPAGPIGVTSLNRGTVLVGVGLAELETVPRRVAHEPRRGIRAGVAARRRTRQRRQRASPVAA